MGTQDNSTDCVTTYAPTQKCEEDLSHFLFHFNTEPEIEVFNWHRIVFKSPKLYSWFAKRFFFSPEVLEWEGGKKNTQLTLLPTAREEKVISFTGLVYKQFYF